MPVSKTYQRLVEEALRPWVTALRFRNMFGGVGIYQGSLFFALLAEDQLYFKVGDSNRADFEALGSQPFRPFGDHGPVMQYYEVPLELLETPGRIQTWVEGSLSVAHAALANKAHRPRRKPKARKAPVIAASKTKMTKDKKSSKTLLAKKKAKAARPKTAKKPKSPQKKMPAVTPNKPKRKR
ncbi:MAG: TfoX/Sxy family protein [Pirellulales bacterium]